MNVQERPHAASMFDDASADEMVHLPSGGETAGDVDCLPCMDIARHVLELAHERGVIRNLPRAATLERLRRTEDS